MELLRRYSNRTDVLERIEALLELTPVRQPRVDPPTPPQRHRRLTAEETTDLLQRYKAGETVYELGAAFGINRRTVSTILKRKGAQLRWRKLTHENKVEACRLYETGESLSSVAARFHVSASTILGVLRRNGVASRPVGTNQWR